MMSDALVINVIKETLLLGHERSRWGNLIGTLLGLKGWGVKYFSGGRKLTGVKSFANRDLAL